MMKAIVCILPKSKGILSFCKLAVSPLITCQRADIGGNSVCIYTLNPLWKFRIKKTVFKLLEKHPHLLFDESMKRYPPLYRTPSLPELFLKNLDKILSCYCGGRLIRPAIIAPKKDDRLISVLKVFSHHAKAVSLCTGDSSWFEEISPEALKRWGLSLTQREQIAESDFTLILSPKTVQILGTDSQNQLIDFSSPSVAEFSEKFPDLRFPHCCLVPEKEEIQKLIWKIQKKS